MTRASGSNIIRFFAALASVAALTVGAPVLLVAAARWRFGGGAPWHGVAAPAEWSRIRRALTDQLTEQSVADIVIRSALTIAWVALIVLAVTIVAELIHMVRHAGLSMPDVRGLGLVQSSARVIAAGLLVVVPMFTSPQRSSALVHDVSTSMQPSFEVDADSDGSSPAIDPPPAGSYVVQPGDSVYGIAERFADGEAVAAYADRLVDLNVGRVMPDGRRFDNAAFIDVGWILELPDASLSAEPVDVGEPEIHVVESGESLWSIAEDELGDAERWPEIFEANRGRSFPDGRTLRDPSTIQPGWDLQLPGANTGADDVPTTVAPAPVEAPVEPLSEETPPSSVDVPRLDVPRVEVPSVDRVDPTPEARPTNRWTGGASTAPAPVPAERLIGDGTVDAGPQVLTMGRAAMLSAGVLTLLAVRRRSRLRRSLPRASLPVPSPDVAATERALRSIDPGDRFLRVDIAVRAASPALVADDERVVAVLVGDDGAIELVASGAADLEPPWEASSEPDRWCLPASVPLELLADTARRVGAPCPTLVQLGRATDGRDLYVDLEALGAIEIGGPGDRADAIVTALAATLAASVLAEVTTLVAVGVDDTAFLGHRHHVPARDPADAFQLAAAAIGSTPTHGRSTFDLRARGTGGEVWEPAVVLVGAAAGTVRPPVDRMALAVVSASPVDGPSSRLEPDDDAWVLRPLGVRCTPVGLEPDELTALAALVASADAELVRSFEGDAVGHDARSDVADVGGVGRPILELGGGPILHLDDDVTLAPLPDSSPPDTSPPLLVRLLGPVGVDTADGRSAAFDRSKAKELVAWLATHRDRSTRTAARTALWELDVRDSTFANVVSEARRTLARLVEPPAGEEWIGRTLTEALPLHPLVWTDADVLEAAMAAARGQPPQQAIATLAPAVDLIVGMPFEGTGYLWPEAEGLASRLVLLATSATAELAAHHLSMGDVAGVFDATGRGLRVLPGHEELIGLRMRAHARAGDQAGVRYEWEQYERVIDADPWSDGEPSPTLVELRHELLAR